MTLPELLQHFSVPFRRAGESHHVTKDWLGANCPLCQDDGFHLGLNDRPPAATCWRCGTVRFGTILEELTGRPWAELRVMLDGASAFPDAVVKRGKLVLPNGVGPLLPAHCRYLEGRNYNPDETAEVWGVGGIGLAARYAWRLFLPVTQGGKVVSWTTRGTTDRPPRYLSAPPEMESVSLRRTLYGENLVNGHSVIVVEGPTDCWRIGPGAIATYGSGWSRSQVLRIGKYARRTVCFDNESEAQGRAKRLVEALGAFPGETCRVVLKAADPGVARGREIQELRRRFLE